VSWCQAGQHTPGIRQPSGADLLLSFPQVVSGLKEVRDRIASVKNTMKITEAMKLVAAAKVRRAQEAVVNGRPFTENLIKVSSRAQQACPAARSTALQQPSAAAALQPAGWHWIQPVVQPLAAQSYTQPRGFQTRQKPAVAELSV
jgi:hypothetical protein